MASQAKTLLVLGGVLALGIGAAIWLVVSDAAPTGAGGETAAGPDASPDASDVPAKTPVSGPRRPKKAGTASVVGEVRRSKGKVPVADQEVQLIPEKGDPWTVKTDASGAFRITEIPHGGPYELRVAAPKCGTIRIPGIALDRNEKREVGTLWLDPSVRVTAQVRTWSDQPVAGAVVEAFAVAQADNFDWTKAFAQMGQAPVAVGRATTDTEGKAVFPELATGRWTFTATKEGFARSGRSGISVRPDVEPPAVKLYLGTGHPLSGRVVDSAKTPLPGALVLTGPPATAWDLSSAPLRARTTTDAQGHYEFAAIDAGDTAILVGRPGGIPSQVATVRIPNVKQFDVVLKGTASVSGTVTEKDGGKPIEAAIVRAWSWGGGGSNMAEATTDAQGKYTLSVIEGTLGNFTTEKDGWVPADDPSKAQTQSPIREGETQTRDLKMRPGAKISGVVKGPDGPLAGAKVWVHLGNNMQGWTQKSANTDAAGNYEVASLPPGKALVRAEFAGFYMKDFPDNYWMVMQQPGPSPFKVDVVEGGAATKDVEMARGSAVEGRVEGPEGPLAGARVYSPTDYEGGVITGADGAFRIEGVKPSPTTALFAVLEGYAPAATNKPFAVAADQPTTNIVLKMVRVGVVKGTVTVADGSPIKDAQVRVASWQDRQEFQGPMPYYPGNQQGVAAPVRADGSYEIPLGGQPSGKFRVTVTALDRPAATSEPQSIVEGQSEYVVNLTLDGGKDFEGRVIAKQGGAGIAGALVSLQSRGGGRGSMTSFGGMGDQGGQTVWAVTDAEGKFSVTHLAAGKYAVQARADGYVQGNATVDLAASNQVTVEIEPELTIEGTVKFADGTPAEGAQVNAQRDPQPTGGEGGWQPGSGSWGMSGTGGRFRLTALAPGNYKITVSPDWQGELNIRTKTTDAIASGSTDVKIVVESGGVIAGVVLDPQKKPVTGLWVYANPEPKDGKPVEGAASRNVRTKEDGTFVAGGLTDGATYSLLVQSNQGWDMAGSVSYKNVTLKSVAVGTRNIEIVLEEGLSITGTVVDADGKPVANTYLMCNSVSADGKGSRQNRNSMTDASGAFTISGLDPGDCAISMPDWGGAGPGAGLVIQNGDKVPAGTKDVRLVASKGVTITGSVADETGAAIKNAQVSATPKSGGKSRNAASKEDGTFELTGLVAGQSYKLVARVQGRPAGKLDDVAAGANAQRILLAKGLEVSGKVLDEAGAPVKQGQLQFKIGNDPDQRAWTQTDAEGAFKVTGLLDAVYEVECWSPAAQNKGYRKCGTVKGGDTGAQLQIVP